MVVVKKLALFLFLGIILLNFSSSTDLGSKEKGECFSLYQRCDNCTYVNLTKVIYPNGTIETINSEMTKDDVDYNYTFCNTNDLGIYQYTVKGDEDGEIETATFTFEVTPSGKTYDSGQSIGGVAIFAGLLSVAFAFLFIGSKLSQSDKTLPIGFFFNVFAIIIVIFSLHMGWAFAVDILQHETISQGISTLFTVILWSVTGISIIFFILMTFSFIKEFGRMKDKKIFGENFNPITQTYE